LRNKEKGNLIKDTKTGSFYLRFWWLWEQAEFLTRLHTQHHCHCLPYVRKFVFRISMCSSYFLFLQPYWKVTGGLPRYEGILNNLHLTQKINHNLFSLFCLTVHCHINVLYPEAIRPINTYIY
jgi:hypothetical protein